MPFAVCEQADGVPAVLTGVIDLVHRTAGRCQVVNYNTDRDAAAGLPAKYADQIADCEGAWRKFVPEAVTPVLVSTRSDEPAQSDRGDER